MDIDTPAANVIFLPTTTHTASLLTQNGRITTQHRSRFTSICTKLRISMTATNISSTGIQSSPQSGMRVTRSGRSRCRKKMGLSWKTMLTFLSTLEECSSMIFPGASLHPLEQYTNIVLATGSGQMSKVFTISRVN